MLDLVANIRRAEICELLAKNRAVNTAELAKSFDVSIETIRKDLLILEKEAKLMRVHGGAILKSASKPYMKLSKRMESMQGEKLEAARLAARLVNNGDVIAIDSGSTAVEFTNALTERFDSLTIVTHSLDVFQRASGFKNFNVILCGGHFLKSENAFYGDLAEEMLEKLYVSKCFVFPSAVSLKHGISINESDLARMQKIMIGSADEVVVLADSSKFEKTALIKISDLNPNYSYVTDSKLSKDIKNIYLSNDIKLLTQTDDIKKEL